MADPYPNAEFSKDMGDAGSLSVLPLSGRRILLIGIGFYDYEMAIADEFHRLGALVYVEDERPPALRNRLAPLRRKILPVTDAEYRQHLNHILNRARANGPFDYILVIKGELLDARFIAEMRVAQPTAQMISYQWDSMERYPTLVERQALFDRVLTFDHADYRRYSDFLLRPTFFRPEITAAAGSPANTTPSVDFCFVGWLHHDRLQQVETLRRQISDLGMSGFFYLFTGMRTAAQLKISGRGQDVHWRALSFASYAEKIATCRVIIDLPHPDQSGLTMRALEAVGTGKKMVTTSRDVTLYDFYSPEQFLIIDAKEPWISPEFLASPAPSLPKRLVESYSLRAWALDILGLTTPPPFLR